MNTVIYKAKMHQYQKFRFCVKRLEYLHVHVFLSEKKPMFVNQHKDISRELMFDLMSLKSQNKWTNYHKLAVIIFYSFLQKYSLYLCKKWAFYWMIWICWVNSCWLCIMFLFSSLFVHPKNASILHIKDDCM